MSSTDCQGTLTARSVRASCGSHGRARLGVALLGALLLWHATGCSVATRVPERQGQIFDPHAATTSPAAPASAAATPARPPAAAVPSQLPTTSWSVLVKQGRDALRSRDLPAAEAHFTQAYALTRDFRAGDPRTAATVKNLERVATAYYEVRQLTSFERVMQLLAQLTTEVPDARTPEAAGLFKVLAASFVQQGRHDEARDALERALAIFGNQSSDADPALVGLHAQLGITYIELGNEELGRQHSQLALGIAESAQGSESPLYAQALVGRARMDARLGNAEQAEADLLEAIRISVAYYGEHNPATGAVVYELAGFYRHLGRNDEARAQFERVISIWDGIPGERFQQALARNDLAWLLVEIGQPAPAEGFARKALLLLRDQRKYEEAESLYERALGILAEQASPPGANNQGIALHYAELLEATGRVAEADRLRASAAPQDEPER
jgi:tetratricopeptide (TPR) repeat protein